MKAVQVVERTGPSGVRVRHISAPNVPPGHVLVEVKAAGVTFPDVLLTQGAYQETPGLPFVLGGEFAGVVRKASPESGDRVVCSSALCGFAELAAVPVDRVLPLPADVPYEVGACLPANYLTMLYALTRRGRLRPGERVLVHGASGGVGMASVQLALALGASQVIAVTSHPLPQLTDLADVLPVAGFRDAVLDLTDGIGVDIVVDPVGGDRLEASLPCLAPGGRALVLGFASGTIPAVDVSATQEGNVDLVGVGWGAYLAHRPGQLRQTWDRLMDLVHEHRFLRPPLDRILPLDDAAEALEALASRTARGRLVLKP